MKNRLPFLLVSIVIFACSLNSNIWGAPVAPALASTETVLPTPTETLTPLPPATVTPTFTPTPAVIQRVLIVSFDGMRPDAIEKAPMENLLSLMRLGATSLTAQTIYPSTTLPAHSSMLVGVCVAKHHVIWNDYIPENGDARGTDLFDLAHAAGLRTVMIVGKEKLRQVTAPESTDVFKVFEYEDETAPEDAIADEASREIRNGFGLMFVHFPTGDLMGHEFDWMSSEQLAAYREGDAGLGQMMAALVESGLDGSTLIIVTSDHGGHNSTHGSRSPEDMTIPWVVAGAGVQAGQIHSPVYTMDTAATAAYVLGLPAPKEWDGVPVYEAFGLPSPARDQPVCK